MTRTLSRPERIAWARLARTPRIGPLTFHRLLARFTSASAALEALPRISDAKPPDQSRIGDELDALESMGARLLACCEPDYPPLLAQLDAPPPLLAVRGDVKLLKRPAIALIGARDSTVVGACASSASSALAVAKALPAKTIAIAALVTDIRYFMTFSCEHFLPAVWSKQHASCVGRAACVDIDAQSSN